MKKAHKSIEFQVLSVVVLAGPYMAGGLDVLYSC